MNVMIRLDIFDDICELKEDLGLFMLSDNYVGIINSEFKEVIEGIANVGNELTSININMKFEINSSI